jgi:predicted DNA-binding transcriptional regulator YafY
MTGDQVIELIAGLPARDAGQRTFRLDRVVEAEVTDLPAHRPDGFELADAWQRVVDEVEQRRSGASATVLVDPWLVRGLRLSFGRYLDVAGEEPDGRLRATVAAQSTTAVAEQLAGWATLIDVVGPPDVMSELARIGADLVDRYGA